MMNIFKNIFNKNKQPEISYKKKFETFQSLLECNDDAHKILSEMAEYIGYGYKFSEGTMLKNFRELIRNTEHIISNLVIISGGKYKNINIKINDIIIKCYKILETIVNCPRGWDCDEFNCYECAIGKVEIKKTLYPYDMCEVDDTLSSEIGYKMSRLGEIRKMLNIPVPEGFCISHTFFDEILDSGNLREKIEDILERIDYENIKNVQEASRDIQASILETQIPKIVEERILYGFEWSFKDENTKMAVRSSAVGEDSDKYSFAGLNTSLLNISKANLIEACLEVLISKYSPQSLVYRYVNGLRDCDMPMSIGCVRMLDAVAAGVLFTTDPINYKKQIIIHAVRGIGNLVVDGHVTPQEFIVNHSVDAKTISFKSGNQDFQNTLSVNEGLTRQKITDELNSQACLNSKQIKELVSYSLKIEKHYGTFQDIEWALTKDGKIIIIQARPLKIGTEEIHSKKNTSELTNSFNDRLIIESGDCASHGNATGKVFIVNNIKDIGNFIDKSILVAKKNLPEFTSLIHKVAGVITDFGSTTGHLSIIARELKVPVLTNTGNASNILQNGQEITLDATNKKVYTGKINELLSQNYEEGADPAFIDSPLYKIWHSLSRFIFKLNLTDVNSTDFNFDKCKTIHDILRFSHEMSMREMFKIYENTNDLDENTYRLKFTVPLDLNIIDLGDGLKPEHGKHWVKVEEIDSTPLRALIEGMTMPGVKWSGYIGLDVKGFGSIIMENIVDINRVDRLIGSNSYALISKNYVNFFSRLGYHFSRLDAFAGDEINSNYINFNFRGGAADLTRRIRRAMVVRRILMHFNFSAIRQEDNVIANIRKVKKEEILILLKEVGRMMGSIRNADVVMTTDSAVDHFVDAFLNGDPNPAQSI